MTQDPTGSGSPRYRLLVLAMLVLVYTFNFLDRQIIAILAVPIQQELGLSDTELGVLGGIAFALFYTLLGIPIALLADRGSRTAIMTVALVAWSLMTAVCGLAQNFWQLFLARLGVGVGEAGGAAPAYSLIADYFPPHQRARAFAIYFLGIPLGSALGILLGGFIASLVDWRMAFLAVGAAGVLVAPAFRWLVREPPRGQFDRYDERRSPPGVGAIVQLLSRKPAFWYLTFGVSAASMMGYGLLFWTPMFLVRSHGLTLLEASLNFAAMLLVGGAAGIWCGGWLADRLGATRRRAYAIIPGVSFLCAVPCLVGAVSFASLGTSFVLFLVPVALSLAWLAPVAAAVQHLVPPDMRTTATAIFLFVNNLIGLGVGTVALGALSEGLAELHGEESLRRAIMLGSVCYVIAGGALLLSARRLEQDWE